MNKIADDLRLGNLIMDQEGKYAMIEEIQRTKKNGVIQVDVKYEYWPHVHEDRNYGADRPIPLREELLKKVAFVNGELKIGKFNTSIRSENDGTSVAYYDSNGQAISQYCQYFHAPEPLF